MMADVWRTASRHFWLIVFLQSFRLCFCDTSRGVKSFSLVGIRMCKLLCIQRSGCEFFLYNHALLMCHLANNHKPTEIGEGYIMRRVDKSKDSGDAGCSRMTCNHDARCLNNYHGDTVCVKDKQHPKTSVEDKQHSKTSVEDKQHPKTSVEDKQHSKKSVEDKKYSQKNVEEKQIPQKNVKDSKKQPAAEYFGCFHTRHLRYRSDIVKKEKGDVPFDLCKRECHEGAFGIHCAKGCYCHFTVKRHHQRIHDSCCNTPRWMSDGNPRCGSYSNLAIYNITGMVMDRSKP